MQTTLVSYRYETIGVLLELFKSYYCTYSWYNKHQRNVKNRKCPYKCNLKNRKLNIHCVQTPYVV